MADISEKITRLGFEILDLIRREELSFFEARTLFASLAVTYEQMMAIEDVTGPRDEGEMN